MSVSSLPDPQEVVASLLSQSKHPVAFGPSASAERRLGYSTTVFTILGHVFEAHDIQRQQALRHLVDNTLSGLAETVAEEEPADASPAFLRGVLAALKALSGTFETPLHEGGAKRSVGANPP